MRYGFSKDEKTTYKKVMIYLKKPLNLALNEKTVRNFNMNGFFFNTCIIFNLKIVTYSSEQLTIFSCRFIDFIQDSFNFIHLAWYTNTYCISIMKNIYHSLPCQMHIQFNNSLCNHALKYLKYIVLLLIYYSVFADSRRLIYCWVFQASKQDVSLSFCQGSILLSLNLHCNDDALKADEASAVAKC